MIYLGWNRVSKTAQVRWTVTLFVAPWRRQDARCPEGSKRIPAMKSPLFLRIFLVALSLCTSSPFFAYARSAAPAVSYPSDAQGAQTSEAVMRSEERRVGKECRSRWSRVSEEDKGI